MEEIPTYTAEEFFAIQHSIFNAHYVFHRFKRHKFLLDRKEDRGEALGLWEDQRVSFYFEYWVSLLFELYEAFRLKKDPRVMKSIGFRSEQIEAWRNSRHTTFHVDEHEKKISRLETAMDQIDPNEYVRVYEMLLKTMIEIREGLDPKEKEKFIEYAKYENVLEKIELLSQEVVFDNISNQKDAFFLIKHYLRVIDASKKPNSTPRLNRAQGLIAKCLEHSISTIYLLRGTQIPEINIGFKDFGTVHVTARAALESFLVFGYIFSLPQNEADHDLRYFSWQLSGLLDRQNNSSSITNLTEEQKQKILREKNEIEELKEKMRSNATFKNMDQDQKISAMGGYWRKEHWTDIGVNLGFNKAQIQTVYSYLCSQAHSGGLSGIQYTHAVTTGDKSPPSESVEWLVLVILANMIELFCRLFPKSKQEHELVPDAVELVEFYIALGKKPL